jgi:hypothetical protein
MAESSAWLRARSCSDFHVGAHKIRGLARRQNSQGISFGDSISYIIRRRLNFVLSRLLIVDVRKQALVIYPWISVIVNWISKKIFGNS